MTSTETGKELHVPLWCKIFDLMLWMTASLSMQSILPKWASQSNIVKGNDMEILEESPIFPNCVCGILIWARGYSMEGIKMHVTSFHRKKMTGPIYHCSEPMYWKPMFWGVVVPALLPEESWVVGFTFNAMNSMICWAVSCTCFLEQYFQGLSLSPMTN